MKWRVYKRDFQTRIKRPEKIPNKDWNVFAYHNLLN